MQKLIFPQKIQKSLCITTKSLYTNSKFQTQLSRKLQQFRTCIKNEKCSIFHDLSEYIIFSYDCNLLDWSFKYANFGLKYANKNRLYFKIVIFFFDCRQVQVFI